MIIINSDIVYYDINTFQFIRSYVLPKNLEKYKFITIFQDQLCYLYSGSLCISDGIKEIRLLLIGSFKYSYVYDDKLIIIYDYSISIFNKDFKLINNYREDMNIKDSLLINNHLVTSTFYDIRITNLETGMMYTEFHWNPEIWYTSRDNTFLLNTSLKPYMVGNVQVTPLTITSEFYEFIPDGCSNPDDDWIENSLPLIRKVIF